MSKEGVRTCQKISDLYGELQEEINNFNARFDSALAKEEGTLLEVCKRQLAILEQEVEMYRRKMSSAGMAKGDTVREGGERWEEGLSLVKMCQSQAEELKKLRYTIDVLQHDNRFLEKELKKAKRENKAIQLSARKPESALATLEPVPSIEIGTKSGTGTGTGIGIGIGAGLETGTVSLTARPTPGDMKSSGESGDKRVRLQDFFRELGERNLNKELVLLKCQDHCQELITKHKRVVEQLRRELDHERKISLKLRAIQQEADTTRPALQRLFSDCVEATRLHVSRQSKMGGRASQGEFSTPQKAQLLEQFLTNATVLKALQELLFGQERKEAEDQSSPSKEKVSSKQHGSEIRTAPRRGTSGHKHALTRTVGQSETWAVPTRTKSVVETMGDSHLRSHWAKVRYEPPNRSYRVHNGKLLLARRAKSLLKA